MSGAGSNRSEISRPRNRGVSNNILALLALVFMAISISCSIIVYMGTGPGGNIIGFSTSQDTAYVNVHITLMPEVTFFSPVRCGAISGITTLTANASSIIGPEGIGEVRFYYTEDFRSESGWVYMGSDFYDGDNYYNVSWDTAGVEDGLYLLGVVAIDTNSLSSLIVTKLVSVNNIPEEPDWEEFKTNVSTNLSLMSEWDNVPDLILGNSSGFLNFSGRILNVDRANLSKSFNISYKRFYMDGIDIPCIDGQVFLHFTGVRMVAPNVYRNGVPCSSSSCTLLSNNQGGIIVSVSDFAMYQLVNNANYDIWDITDVNRTPGNQTRYKRQQVEFFLNLSANGIPLNSSDVRCFIRFNNTYTDTGYTQIEFKNRSLYEYNRSFRAPGKYTWEVTCNSTDDEYFSIYAKDNVTISNRAPRLIKNLPNITMEEDTVALYINDLNDYFEDPEGDRITFTVSYMPNVATRVVGERSILITPARDWFGNRTFVVYATDEFGLMNISNLISLVVKNMPEPPRPRTGGGGGSAGSVYYYDRNNESPDCIDDWICSGWSDCTFRWTWNATGLEIGFENLTKLSENEGIMTRSCYDNNHCNYDWKRPNETGWCFYVPTCSDSIWNGNETGVDCGGPCSPCFTCDDGIQNQGEEGVDCGGPCTICANCNDGIMNCHGESCEKGIDCGGPCSNVCPTQENPQPRIDLFTLLMMGILIIALFFTVYLFIRPYLVRIYIGLMGLKNKKEEAPEATLLEIETHYLALLGALRRRASRADPAEISGELNSLFRKFLMIAYKIKEEKTLEELSALIKNMKIPGMLRMALTTYIGDIVRMGYSRTRATRSEIISKIDRANELLDIIVRNMPKDEAHESSDKKEGKARPSKKTGMAGKAGNAGKVGNAGRTGNGGNANSSLGELYRLGISARRALVKNDLNAAADIRKNMGKVYKKLKKHEREHYRLALKELDKEISAAKKGDKD